MAATQSAKACHKVNNRDEHTDFQFERQKRKAIDEQADFRFDAEHMLEAFRKKAQHKEDENAILRKLSLDQLSSQDVHARQRLRAKQLAALQIGAEVVTSSQTTVAESRRKEEDELIKRNHDDHKS